MIGVKRAKVDIEKELEKLDREEKRLKVREEPDVDEGDGVARALKRV